MDCFSDLISPDLIEVFGAFLNAYFCPHPLVLRTPDEKPWTVWQRVISSRESSFLSRAIILEMISFSLSTKAKKKMIISKQFIAADGEVSPDFAQDVASTTGDTRGEQLICHSCQSCCSRAASANCCFQQTSAGSWIFLEGRVTRGRGSDRSPPPHDFQPQMHLVSF